MTGLVVQRCEVCQHRMFPRRLACSRCGSTALVAVPAGPGVVLDRVEILRSPGLDPGRRLVLLRVELEGGPRLVARASGPSGLDALVRGSAVTITEEEGALVAAAG